MKDTSEKALAISMEQRVERLDELAQQYGAALAVTESPFKSALTLARAMGELRELLTPEVMAPIMALMNSPLGFLTDRTGRANWKGETKPLYSVETVRDCVIEATLRGFSVVGNEMNIIADRFYAAKAGLSRRVKQIPTLSEYKDGIGIPKVQVSDDEGKRKRTGALVTCWATWKIHGIPDRIDREFAVKGDDYATADSYVGKAQRKLYAAVLERITGQSIPEGEVGEEPLAGEMKEAQAKVVEKPNLKKEAPQPETPPEDAPAAPSNVIDLPHRKILVGLEANGADERWFVQELKKKFPDLVAKQAKIVDDLSDGMAEKILSEGVGDILATLGFTEA